MVTIYVNIEMWCHSIRIEQNRVPSVELTYVGLKVVLFLLIMATKTPKVEVLKEKWLAEAAPANN